MDFKGQKLCEQLYTLIVTVAAVVAFLAGYLRQDFNLMIGLFTGGVALACAVCVPDWPWFNRHPLKWLKPVAQTGEQGAARGSRKPEATWKNFWNLF